MTTPDTITRYETPEELLERLKRELHQSLRELREADELLIKTKQSCWLRFRLG